MSTAATPTLMIDFAVDEATVRQRVLGHMRIGLFTPSDVPTVGSISSIHALLVPARRVHFEATSNWTAESGSKSGNNVQWSAASGQHRGTYGDQVSLAATGPWSAAANLALRAIAAAHPVADAAVPAVERVAPSVSVADTTQQARKRVELEETRACGAMIPGALKRNLKVNTSIDGQRVEDVWVPVYTGVFRYGTSEFTFCVDGVGGVVVGARPTSPKRVLTALGMFGLFIAASAAWQSYQDYQGRLGAERAALFACTASLATANEAMKNGDAGGADDALARSEPLCTKGAGEEAVRALDEARASVKAERERQDAALRAAADAAFAGASAEIDRADTALAARDVDAASAVLEALRKELDPYKRLDPAPEGLSAVDAAVADREHHEAALRSLAQGETGVAVKQYVLAEAAYAAGSEALRTTTPQYATRPLIAKLQAELRAGTKRVAKPAEAERRKEAAEQARMEKEQREAEALAQLCGDRPMPDAWDAGIAAVESYMKMNANDPDSIDDENCTVPILTKACWKTVCTVRGKNAFGALIATRQTFFIGRNPSMPSLHVVLASE